MNKDIWSIPLLLVTIIGALKGSKLPYIIPQLLASISLALLIYRGFFIKSKYALLYTVAIWLSLTWMLGIYANAEYAGNVLMKIPFYFMLLFTAVVAFVHQRIYRRLNPVTVRGLDIEPKETPFSQWVQKIQNRFVQTETEKRDTIELITFDLGEVIEHKNR